MVNVGAMTLCTSMAAVEGAKRKKTVWGKGDGDWEKRRRNGLLLGTEASEHHSSGRSLSGEHNCNVSDDRQPDTNKAHQARPRQPMQIVMTRREGRRKQDAGQGKRKKERQHREAVK